eukprot:ANDGO_02563.mRNA.1 Exocyst complex component SEC10
MTDKNRGTQGDASPQYSYIPYTIFQKDRFQTEFDETLFIDSLTHKLLSIAKKDAHDLHASEFDTLFRESRRALLKMLKEVNKDIDAAEQDVEESESAYNEEVSVLRTEMDDVFRQIKGLDDTITNIGGSALQIGERLENLDLQKSRALEARDLLDYFEHFMTVDTIEDMPIEDMVPILKELMACSSGLTQSNPAYEAAVKNIDACCEEVEKELLEEFDAGVKMLPENSQEGLAQMRDCATILFELSRADQCMRRYVNMNELFLRDAAYYMKDDSQREKVRTLSFQELPNLSKLFENIEEVIDREFRIMKYVFIDYEKGVQLLIERIFEQTIQFRLNDMLSMDDGDDLMVFLQTLAKVQTEMDELVKRITKYELADFNPRQLAESILAPYKKGYIDKELVALTDYYDQLFNDFMESEGIMPSIAEQQQLQQQQLQQHNHQVEGQSQKTNIFLEKLQQAQMKLQEKVKKLASIFVRKDSTHLSTVVNPLALETVTKFIYYNEESLSRCRRLSAPAKVPEYCMRVFYTLLDRLGTFLQNVLDAGLAVFNQPNTGSREDVGVSFLFLVSVANHIVLKLERHYENELAAVLDSSLTFRMEVNNKKQSMLNALENRIVQGLEKTVRLLVLILEQSLHSLQKKTDFRPREEASEGIASGPTAACRSVVNVLNKYFSTINMCLDGRNREICSVEFGKEVYRLLIRHLKSLTINSVGALQWMRDASEYQQCVAALNSATVDELFDRLRDLANIYLVEPESLRDTITSSSLVDMNREELIELIKLREDFRNSGRKAHDIVQSL